MSFHFFNGISKQAVALLLIIGFASCQSSEQSRKIMEKEKFVSLLVDVYIAEARLSTFPIEKDSAIKLFIPLEDQLLEKYNVSDSLLKNTYRYYIDHPDEFDKIYDIVVDTLNLRHQKLEAVRN